MRRIGAHRALEREEVGDVRLDPVFGVGCKLLVRPGVSAAVGDHTVLARDSRELWLPDVWSQTLPCTNTTGCP